MWPPGLFGVGVGLGVDGVVVVLGVGRIDGDERDVAPVLAALERGLLGLLGLRMHRGGEAVGDFEVVDGDHG